MKVFISTAIMGIVLFTTSCSTCTTCTYYTKSGEELSEEFCGNSEEVINFKGDIEEEANENRSTYHCVQNH